MTTLTRTQLQQLDHSLQQDSDVSVFKAHGLLTALNCHPVLLPVEEWLPSLWGEERTFKDWQEMTNLLAALGTLNQDIAESLKNNQLVPLVDYDASSNLSKLDEIQKEACLQWCAGFSEGLSGDMAFWTEDTNEDVLSSIVAISALAQLTLDDVDDEDLDEIFDEDEDDEEDEDEDEEYDDEEEDEEYEEYEDELLLSDEEIAETMQHLPFFVAKLYQHKLAATQAILETSTE